MILLPQSACSEPGASCTGFGLPEFGNHGQHVPPSAPPQPKSSNDRSDRRLPPWWHDFLVQFNDLLLSPHAEAPPLLRGQSCGCRSEQLPVTKNTQVQHQQLTTMHRPNTPPPPENLCLVASPDL